MRNPARIYSLLNKIGDIWIKYPDLRLGQLIDNIKVQGEQSDLFQIEDDRFEQLISIYAERLKKCENHLIDKKKKSNLKK